MFKKLLFLPALLCAISVAMAQQVRLLSVQQMEQRFKTGRDTVYVVNFWATWCAPCVAELPYFEKLQETYSNQPLKVLLVSMDFESKLKSDVAPFVKKRKLSSEVFLASKKSEQEFIDHIDKSWSGAIPATLVVNSAKKTRKFYEKEFTYMELNSLYQTNK